MPDGVFYRNGVADEMLFVHEGSGTLDDLERYCYFVAGTVGKLLTSLFELEVPGLPAHLLTPIRARAVSFGVALQLENIVKDVAEDHVRGDCFLPEELAEAEGISLDDILDPERPRIGVDRERHDAEAPGVGVHERGQRVRDVVEDALHLRRSDP
mgnify:CR=1 FL=1